ncbi:MAG TPA: YerC/YecD family TrpR-related protein [Oscillospiraceae bacterium]|nr:YerC/YecD family TrpR-related protein [Oscillospiraceae bacterium]HRW57619.1 YerC/YecD family TrpR-related protein [Oscillospiraceae bacterium]
MNNKLKNSNMDFLFDAVLTLKTREECYNFFEDLCTMPEMKALSQRIVVAKMLTEHKVYSDIVSETGASTATISRVNRSLIYGSDGYAVAFKRLMEKEADGQKEPADPAEKDSPEDAFYQAEE